LASGAIDLYLIKQKSNLRISSCELSSNNWRGDFEAWSF
jgi:hypothetical protein